MSKYIIIRTFNNSIEAHIIQGKLLAHGVPCFIQDEHIVSLNPFYNIAVGGIKVMINEDDREIAEQVLVENI